VASRTPALPDASCLTSACSRRRVSPKGNVGLCARWVVAAADARSVRSLRLQTESSMSFKPLDADYLLRVLDLPVHLRRQLEAFRARLGDLNAAEISHLRELVGNRLVEVGFDEHDELTPEGARLSELIDDLHPW
jgi:hypothetical protein